MQYQVPGVQHMDMNTMTFLLVTSFFPMRPQQSFWTQIPIELVNQSCGKHSCGKTEKWTRGSPAKTPAAPAAMKENTYAQTHPPSTMESERDGSHTKGMMDSQAWRAEGDVVGEYEVPL